MSIFSTFLAYDALDDDLIDAPPLCPRAATMQAVAHRQRDKVVSLEADMAHQSQLSNNVDVVNEVIGERFSGLFADNRALVKDLAAARSLPMKYKAGFWIVTWMLIFAVTHILFYPRN